MLMDIKGGSNAAVSGGSGENTEILNASENLMGAVDNYENVPDAEQGEIDAPRAEVTPLYPEEPRIEESEQSTADTERIEPSEQRAEVTELNSGASEEAQVEQDAEEFGKIVDLRVKRNEDDIDKHVASEFYGHMKKYGYDPYAQAKIFFIDGWKYKKGAFNRGVGDGLTGAGEIAA